MRICSNNVCMQGSLPNSDLQTMCRLRLFFCVIVEQSMRSFGGFTIDFSASREAIAGSLQKVWNDLAPSVPQGTDGSVC